MSTPEQWQRLREGDTPGRVMEWDVAIDQMRRSGMSLNAIGRSIGKRKSYVQNRLYRIAAREEFDDACNS